jgi:hypothetical protein
MHILILAMIAAVTLASYLTDLHVVPRALKFLPEMMSGVAVLYVVAAGIPQRFRWVNSKYWLVFFGLVAVLVCGAIAESVGPGPIVSGMRYYLRAMPFFFLPAVYEFKDWQLRQYFQVLFAICLLQIPTALYERHAIMAAAHYDAADAVIGTLGESGVMSMFLICALCLLAAAMLRGYLSKWLFVGCFLLLIVPMSINETKITAFLLPLGLLTTFILAAPAHRKLRTAIAGLCVLVVGGAIFVPVFDYYQSKSDVRYTIGGFLSDKKELGNYLDTDARVGSGKEAGRVDAILVPLQELSHDPVKLAFGLGVGNASKSNLGRNFTGVYYRVYSSYATESSVAVLLLETGLLGAGLVLLLHWMVFRDTLYMARHGDGLAGTFAVGFVGVVLLMTIGLFYVTIHIFESISYLFWFFAGYVAAKRARAVPNAMPMTLVTPAHPRMV